LDFDFGIYKLTKVEVQKEPCQMIPTRLQHHGLIFLMPALTCHDFITSLIALSKNSCQVRYQADNPKIRGLLVEPIG